ncbi:hypothetical protein Tsubulata_034370 [Turnera subulata]|uniref:DUF6821 domain-containing protein n=1 Tax=Turnera subulata TaxID=218843 RepID=A0A9Q0FU04_9ROSI|nr:hypothetical protein Tsubulata_034370 [Turnera subulata]
MEGEAPAAAAAVTEFQDWELLANSDSDAVHSPTNSARDFGEIIEGDSGGMFRLDYFSLENDGRFAKVDVSEDEDGSIESDNPSWVDPGTETRFHRRNSAELWPDSGSDRSDERKSSEFDGKTDVGLLGSVKTDVGFEGIGEVVDKEGKVGDFVAKTELGLEESVKSHVGFEAFGESQSKDKDLVMFWSDSGGEGLVSDDVVKVGGVSEPEPENLGGLEEGNGSREQNLSVVAEEENKRVAGGPVEKRKVVWWKVPFEVLRYCVFRVSPVWTFSMAAAVMGFVILGRRLYRMKRKTRSLQIKVAVDDKKVSQAMSRAARLNEAFSVVRRVPIVRPLVPATGAHPWPMMSLR